MAKRLKQIIDPFINEKMTDGGNWVTLRQIVVKIGRPLDKEGVVL